jgi:hypothetical protein
LANEILSGKNIAKAVETAIRNSLSKFNDAECDSTEQFERRSNEVLEILQPDTVKEHLLMVSFVS